MNLSYKLYYLPRIILLLTSLASVSTTTFAQQREQRYSRFQYHKYRWRVLHTNNCHIYFPINSDSLCSFIVKKYPGAQQEVKKRMLSGLDKAPNIIIYPSVDQLYESNIGSFEPAEYTLPTFVMKGSRLVLAFNGSYKDMEAQLREAIARYVWELKIKSETIEVRAKGGADEAIPLWFKEGAIRYFGNGWPVSAEDALKLSFKQNNFKDWYQVISYQPRLSGQAMCYFLSEQYFKTAPAQVLFQMIKKNLQRSLRFITKKDMHTLLAQCFHFYTKRFNSGSEHQGASSLAAPHPEGIVRNVSISPDEHSVAYVLSAKGKRTVYVFDKKTSLNRKIISYTLPPWISDPSKDIYPLLLWAKEDRGLQIAMPIKGKINILRYTPTGSFLESIKLYGVDGISSFTPLADREYLLSGYRRGQSDIVTYNERKEKYTVLTDDVYDDSHPLLAGKELFFLSNRSKDSVINAKKTSDALWQGIYSLANKKLKLVNVDSIEYSMWDKLQQLQDGRLLATNTSTGTELITISDVNAHMIPLADAIPHQYHKETDRISFYRTDKDSIVIQTVAFKDWAEKNMQPEAESPWLKDYLKRKEEEADEDSLLKAARDNNPSFLDDVFAVANAKDSSAKNAGSKQKESDNYDPKKVKPYILQLHSAYFTAKVNNDYFMNRYQPYLNYQGQFKFPEVGGMAQGGFTDLFENHHLSIAYRLPAGSEGSSFFFKCLNTAKKLDWGFAYYRNVESLKPDPKRNWVDEHGNPYPNVAKVKTHYYEASLHYPLTYYSGLDFQQALRTDQTIFQATERYSLDFTDIKSTWSITTLSYSINKLKPTVPFLYKGYSVKATVDAFKGFSQDEAALFGSGLQLGYHQPLYKYITLVVQGGVGYSGGDNNLLYILGGTDNNVAPIVDSNVHFAQNAPYAFQTLITPFRGYLQNSLYGNKYALFNIDVYFPLFETLVPIETPLQSINLLQLSIFLDAATAKETWRGATNTNGKRLISYGLGARTSLAGYPITLEVAWPGTFSERPVWYFSLSIK